MYNGVFNQSHISLKQPGPRTRPREEIIKNGIICSANNNWPLVFRSFEHGLILRLYILILYIVYIRCSLF